MDEDAPSEITVLTLNVWGLLVISKQRTERLVEIGRHIAQREPVPHIVALQECFVRADYEAIRRETRFALPYGKYYQGGAFGSGLVILSRWPIEESWHYEYPLGGRPTAITQGDWYVGKGIAGIRTRMGREGEWVEVFNTHTQAPYDGENYEVHRLSQSWQIAKQLHTAALRPGSLVLALGDFNMKPCSLQHRIVTARAPAMRDTWRMLHPDSSLGSSTDPAERARRRPVPTVEYNIIENGCTSNNATNTWRWTPAKRKLLGRPGGDPRGETHIPDDALDERGHRLDYVFANVAGAEKDGEWEEVEPAPGLEKTKTAASPRGGTGTLEKKPSSGGLTNGKKDRDTSSKGSGEKDKDSKSSSRRTGGGGGKRGVHFQDHPVVGIDSSSPETIEPVPKPVWVIRSTRVAVTERHPTLGCSLSDHYGYEVTLVRRTPKRQSASSTSTSSAAAVTSPTSDAPLNSPPSAMKKSTRGSRGRPQTPPGKETGSTTGNGRGTYLDSPTASERRASTDSARLAQGKFPSLPGSAQDAAEDDSAPLRDVEYDSLLSLVQSYSTSLERERWWRYAHFGASLVLTVGLLVGVWWVPTNYGAFIFLLVGMVNFAAGIMDGLYALVFMGRERRCLMEFEWEVGNARSKDRGNRLEIEARVGGG